MAWRVASSTWSTHSFGIPSDPDRAPASPAATAARQSVSRPKFTDVTTASRTSPFDNANTASPFATISFACDAP